MGAGITRVNAMDMVLALGGALRRSFLEEMMFKLKLDG